MSRSIKKGPFVQPVLLKRIKEMNAAGEKRIVKTWSRASVIFRISLDTPLRFTTDANTFRYMLLKIWSATSSVSLPRRERSEGTPEAKHLVNNGRKECVQHGSKGAFEICPYFPAQG